MAVPGHLAERSQELQRQLHISSRAPGQQDPRFDQMRGVVPGPSLVGHRRREIIRPTGGAFKFPRMSQRRARRARVSSPSRPI